MKAKRIVVIDDCRLTLAIANDMLMEAGFEVCTAESGIEANAHIYASPPPDIILVDVELPILRGDRKVRLIKASKKTENIPTIIMSTKSPDELERLAEESGAEAWIAKPLKSELLLPLIRRFIPSGT